MKLKLEIYSPKKINRKKFGERAKKAKELINEVKILDVSPKNAIFSVFDKESMKEYTVIYNKDSPIKWSCSCPYFGIKFDYCAHILAVHLFLYREFRKRNPSLLKFLKANISKEKRRNLRKIGHDLQSKSL